MKSYSKDASAATSSLSSRIKAILDNRNSAVADCDAVCNLEYPDSEPETTPVLSVMDAVKAVSASNLRGGFGYDDHVAMDQVLNAVMVEIAGDEYNPWPELTKEELLFLIGDRMDSPHCPSLYSTARFHAEVPLTFSERVLADRHREWLEKGTDLKRKRLVKAQAEIAKLTGKVA